MENFLDLTKVMDGVTSFRGDLEDTIASRGEGGPCDVRLRLGLFIVPSSAPKAKNELTSCHLAVSSQLTVHLKSL